MAGFATKKIKMAQNVSRWPGLVARVGRMTAYFWQSFISKRGMVKSDNGLVSKGTLKNNVHVCFGFPSNQPKQEGTLQEDTSR